MLKDCSTASRGWKSRRIGYDKLGLTMKERGSVGDNGATMAIETMAIETASAGKLLWVLGVVAWYVIRYPFERRAKRVRVVADQSSGPDRLALGIVLCGMALLPAIYVATGFPSGADYPATLGAI